MTNVFMNKAKNIICSKEICIYGFTWPDPIRAYIYAYLYVTWQLDVSIVDIKQ